MKNKLTIGLIIVIILLVLFIITMFVVRPAIERRDNKLFNQGIEFAIGTIMQEASTCNIVPLMFNNQTINIVAIDCLNIQNESSNDIS